MEDAGETWEFFNKTAGETYATSVSGFQVNTGSMTSNYMDTRSASVEKRQRIDLLDLRDQREGDAHIFFRSKIIRARMFYANPKPAKRMQVNQYLCVEKPPDIVMINLDKRIRRFEQVFSTPGFVMEPPAPNEDINVIAQAMITYDKLQPFERSIAAVICILEKEVEKQKQVREEIELEQSQEFNNEVHAFTPVQVPDFAKDIVGEEDMKRFSNPLLLKGRTREALMHIERLSGQTEVESTKRADGIVNDIIKATYYPPREVLNLDIEGTLQAILRFEEQLFGASSRKAELESNEQDSDDPDDE